jgi:hypothetical protein
MASPLYDVYFVGAELWQHPKQAFCLLDIYSSYFVGETLLISCLLLPFLGGK